MRRILLLCTIIMLSIYTTPFVNGQEITLLEFQNMLKESRRDHMQQVPTRQEVNTNDQWKLEDLFENQAQWDKELAQVKQLTSKISEYQGKLNNPESIKACFELEDQISLHLERLFVYAHLLHDQDTTETNPMALADRAKKLSVEISEALSFITPEILMLSEQELLNLKENPLLVSYEHTFDEMIRHKPHILSKSEEALLAQVGHLSQAPKNIFSMINNADMKFPNVENEQGQEKELTHGSYIQFLESRDRDVRKNAFQAMYDTYRKQQNTIASTLSANITKNIFYSKVRKYSSALEMSLSGDDVPKEVYTNLIDSIHAQLPVLQRYLKLREKLLDVDQLHMYDLFTPLVEQFDMNITYEEAVETVVESLKPLGEEYLTVLKKSFDEGWIDVYENQGKRSGAYSWGAYGTHPYVLLNHKNNLNSMFTLTHEMGHAMHSFFSDEAQTYRDAQYPIFLAEVASTLNEALLMNYLLNKSTDPKEKMYLLTYYADQFRTTVFRQTMFAEFEMIIHDKAEQGESLTPKLLSEIYYNLNVKYHGDDMVVDQAIEMEWARIPHFYTSFYVYKYATGFAAATSFAKQITDEGEPAVERYLGFLESGGSDYPIEILKKAGVDMSVSTPIEQALSVFEEIVTQMEEIANP